MTRRWKYQEPGDEEGWVTTHILTEDEIIRTYFPYWCDQMVKVGKGNLISREHCIEDWVTVHWAWEV